MNSDIPIEPATILSTLEEAALKTPEQLSAEKDLQEEHDLYFKFESARVPIDKLINDWKDEKTLTESRRKLRSIDIDIKKERAAGNIEEDSTFIPVRVIDTNIRREQPPFVAYLKQSKRLAVFKSLDKQFQQTDRLEEEFTDGLTYEGWEQSPFKTLDGAQTHGWDSEEIVYDETKPFKVGFEHIGHDKLLFPLDALNIQFCQRLVREYPVTVSQVKSLVSSFGFDSSQCNLLITYQKDRKESTFCIYKVFFRWDGVVYEAWYSMDTCCNGWLKAPKKLFLGMKHKEVVSVPARPIVNQLSGQVELVPSSGIEQWVDTDINLYPIFILPYTETEQDKIFDRKGRVFLDQFRQEAQTALLTGHVNANNRASNVYSYVDQDDGSGGSVKQLGKLQSGVILNRKINFFHMDYPDPASLSALQYLDVSGSQESGQINFAVSNRKDSRKTATEVSEASQQSTLLSSVQLTLFSTYMRSRLIFAWRIIQSLALQDEIKLLQVSKVSRTNSQTGLMEEIELPTPVNDHETLEQNYSVKPAGDVDFIKRQELVQRMFQMWPLVQGTPLQQVFLSRMLQVFLPEEGKMFSTVLEQGDVKTAALGQLFALTQTLMQNEQLAPEEQANWQRLQQEVTLILNPQQKPV